LENSNCPCMFEMETLLNQPGLGRRFGYRCYSSILELTKYKS